MKLLGSKKERSVEQETKNEMTKRLFFDILERDRRFLIPNNVTLNNHLNRILEALKHLENIGVVFLNIEKSYYIIDEIDVIKSKFGRLAHNQLSRAKRNSF